MPKETSAKLHQVEIHSSGRDEEKDCICPRCPSYPDCAVDPYLRMFCMRGKAPCPIRRKGCMCRGCKVHERHNYSKDFYCEVGTEEEQAKPIR